jgi:hypothetical protein
MHKLKIDDYGFIKGAQEYAGCGSHEAKWTDETIKLLVEYAPVMFEALTELNHPLAKEITSEIIKTKRKHFYETD